MFFLSPFLFWSNTWEAKCQLWLQETQCCWWPQGHLPPASSCQLWIASVQHFRVPQTQQHPSLLLSFQLSSAWEEVTPWGPMHQQHCRITTQDNYTQNSPRTKSEISKGSYDYSRLRDTSFSRTSILEKISGISTQEQGHSCCRREEFGCMCLWDTQRELSSTVFPGTSLPLNSIGLVYA